MNLIDYNQTIEALEKERKFLLNRDQYGAEDILVHHAINVISELPVIRQPKVIMCAECKQWDNKSGLSARKCAEWEKTTTQSEFCSRAVKRDGL